MLMIEAVDAYFTMMRLTTALIEADGHAPGEGGEDWHQVVEKAALGDNAAIGQVYMRYAPTLTKIARGIVGDDAEDIVADVFVKLKAGAFKVKAPDWHHNAQLAWASIKTAVFNAAIHSKNKGAHKSVGSGGEDDVHYDPAASTDSDEASKVYKTVQDAVTKHLEAGKFNDAEKAFIQGVAANGLWSGKAKKGGTQQSNKSIAAPLWPHLSPESAASLGGKAKKRFLKSLCNDPELKALVDLTGAGNTLNAICVESVEHDTVLLFALAAGLVESVDLLDPDATYDVVLGWLSHFV